MCGLCGSPSIIDRHCDHAYRDHYNNNRQSQNEYGFDFLLVHLSFLASLRSNSQFKRIINWFTKIDLKKQYFQKAMEGKTPRRSERVISTFENTSKAYISCGKCASQLNIHAKESITEVETSHKSKGEEDYISIPPSEVFNVKIKNGKGNAWVLQCEVCGEDVGKIKESGIIFRKAAIKEVVIRYERVQTDNLKDEEEQKDCGKNQTKLKKVTKYNQRMKKYLSCSFQMLDRQLNKINTGPIEKSDKQLQNFIKFYHKWTKKEHRNTSYLSMSARTISHQ